MDTSKARAVSDGSRAVVRGSLDVPAPSLPAPVLARSRALRTYPPVTPALRLCNPLDFGDFGVCWVTIRFARAGYQAKRSCIMASSSTQTVFVPEPEKAEVVEPSPQPETKAAPFVIKLIGSIPS